MKTGLLFGSFNPIHTGHLIIAQAALNETGLREIWFMVSPQNPLKSKSGLLGEFDRYRMVELAVESNTRFRASNFEFFLPKPSYTIETLVQLGEKYPNHEFSLIMGEDNLQHLHKWKNHEAILKYHPVFCYPRRDSDGSAFEKYPAVKKFDLPFLDISATAIRQMITQGKSVRYLVPSGAFEYLEENGFYK